MKPARIVLLLAVALAVPACSKEALMRGSYETLHNISDQQNEIDPKYEPDRPSYDVYRQQREQVLHPEPAQGMPASPGTPAGGGSPSTK
jgi:hypothetical protein